ncbi:MAG TPA: lipopolysaccharide biosynthesis protein, partial [Spirochaetales bacterium]|nr:lipopolysaccharide biosynthesis protein [Spirochaetales bacterium]
MDTQKGAQGESAPDQDEISLVDLLATLLRYKKLIAIITLGGMAAALLFAIGSLLLPADKSYLPNLYTPKASILISSSDSGGLSGALAASGLGSLAAMAGVSVGGSSNGQLAVAIATSNTTIDELNGEFNFTSRYKVKKNVKAETRLAVRKHYSAAFDEKTGILSISFEDIDPEYAMAVVNRAVEILDRRFMALSGNKASEQKRVLEAKLADVQAQMNVIQGRI